MDEYISKKRAVDLLRTLPNPYDLLALHTIGMAIYFLEKEPAADVQPVVHAYWLGVGEKFSEDWTCSNCMRARGKGNSSNFCSYCGANMQGDTNG